MRPAAVAGVPELSRRAPRGRGFDGRPLGFRHDLPHEFPFRICCSPGGPRRLRHRSGTRCGSGCLCRAFTDHHRARGPADGLAGIKRHRHVPRSQARRRSGQCQGRCARPKGQVDQGRRPGEPRHRPCRCAEGQGARRRRGDRAVQLVGRPRQPALLPCERHHAGSDDVHRRHNWRGRHCAAQEQSDLSRRDQLHVSVERLSQGRHARRPVCLHAGHGRPRRQGDGVRRRCPGCQHPDHRGTRELHLAGRPGARAVT